MPILSRSGPRLLRQVGGRAHASEAEHEGVGKVRGMSEEDIHAEPVSSGEDEDVSGRLSASASAGREGSSQTSNTSVGSAARGRVRGKRGVRAPARGVYGRGRAMKGDKEEEKENTGRGDEEEKGIYFGMGSSPKRRRVEGMTFGKGVKRKAEEVQEKEEEGKIYWGMGDTPPKKARTVNVHGRAAAPRGFGKRTMFGRAKPSASAPLPRTSDYRHLDDLDAALDGGGAHRNDKDSALSSILDPYDPYCDVSDSDSPSLTSPLPFPASAPPTAPATTTTSSVFDYVSPQSPLASPPALSPLSLLSPTPSPPSYKSAATCPLCDAPVSPGEQAAFYAGRKRTVRNQMLFCRAHKRASALEAYRAAGYPDVEWGAVPERIRGMRGELVGVLRGENGVGEGSVWRERFGERLRSGQGAVVGRRRKRGKAVGLGLGLGELRSEVARGDVSLHAKALNRSERAEEDLDGGGDIDADADADGAIDLFASTACLTGYYGPRGRRVFMETLTSELEGEIREAAARDPTVGRSGFAMFLQAVMVPELVVRLVMEDLGVGRERAGEVVEESAEVGALVNEEVEEVVEEVESSSEGGDY